MGTFYKDIGIDGLSDYCKGIMYASGCIIRAGGMRYLCVRNIDNGMPSASEKKLDTHPIHLCTI